MQALSILPSPHKFLDYDDFAFASASYDHDFSFKFEVEYKNGKLEEDEQEFTFAFANPQESVVTADEIFHNGKIRPLFPILDQEDGANMSLKTRTMDLVVGDSKEMCKKSNSTGFSRLLRCRQDLQLQSYSNGKDAFVFLNPPVPAKKSHNVKVRNDVVKSARSKTTPISPHEKLYMMNRKRKESNKRRSFLPYKQQLFGFFANMNLFSKNLHPF